MSYFPVAENRSGQILASGMMGAADATARAYDSIGSNIGGALANIGKTFGESIEDAKDGEAAYASLQQIAKMFNPLSKVVDGMETLPIGVRGRASQGIMSTLGALSQFAISGINADVRRDQMGVQMAMPRARAAATAAGKAAAGQATVRPMSMPGVDLNFVD